MITQCVDIGLTQRNLMLGDNSRFPIKEMQRVLLRKNSEQDLMDAMEQAIKSRQIRYLFIDEAHHVLMCCTNQKTMDLYMEAIKSISNKGETKLVLAGNYNLLRFLEGSGQLARRTKVVNFSPYLIGSEKDLQSFEKAFLSLLGFYPMKVTDAVLGKLEELFFGSCGCIGILKQWMARALVRGLNERQDYVAWEDFEKTRLQPMALKRIAKDIREGEMLANSASMSEVRSVLMGELIKGDSTRSNSLKPGECKPHREEVD